MTVKRPLTLLYQTIFKKNNGIKIFLPIIKKIFQSGPELAYTLVGVRPPESNKNKKEKHSHGYMPLCVMSTQSCICI